ncbi:MAG: FG-GAP repeat domain-containing protein [Geminicoccaceae bacterium]
MTASPHLRTGPISARLLGAATMAVVAALAGTAFAGVTATKTTIDPSAPAQLRAKGAGDLDGDGRGDLVVGAAGGGIFWYRNGAWLPKRTISPSVVPAEEIEVADLTGDGQRDVLVAVNGGTDWFENGGGGTRWTRRQLQRTETLHDIAVADIDGDGKPDVIGRRSYKASTSYGLALRIWRQVSKTSWKLTTINLPQTGTGLAVARIDSDSKPDIAVGKYWLQNQSTPGVVKLRTHTYNAKAERDAKVVAGDINGDGRTDLFVTPPHPTISGTHKVAWYEAPADRTKGWTEHLLEANVQPVIHSAHIVDLDGDGKKDLVTAMDSLGSDDLPIKIYLNDGDETFTLRTIAKDAQHAMQVLTVGGKKALVGADYNETPRSRVEMWSLTPTP